MNKYIIWKAKNGYILKYIVGQGNMLKAEYAPSYLIFKDLKSLYAFLSDEASE